MPVQQFAPTYDAAVLSVLEQAYSAACREIDIDPHPSDPALNKDLREALAKAIVDMAAAACVIRGFSARGRCRPSGSGAPTGVEPEAITCGIF